MRFIGYYTPGNYEKVMNTYLRPSLEKWNLSHYIEEVSELGNWYLNTSFKPRFIKECLERFKEDVIFLDADADIVKDPILFSQIPEEYDIAVHYLDWERQWRGKPGNKRELLSGTMLFRYNEKVLKMLHIYISECESNIGKWEQQILQEVLQIYKSINIYELPAEYCTVILHNGKVPNYIKDPIIIHNQVSRQFKNKR